MQNKQNFSSSVHLIKNYHSSSKKMKKRAQKKPTQVLKINHDASSNLPFIRLLNSYKKDRKMYSDILEILNLTVKNIESKGKQKSAKQYLKVLLKQLEDLPFGEELLPYMLLINALLSSLTLQKLGKHLFFVSKLIDIHHKALNSKFYHLLLLVNNCLLHFLKVPFSEDSKCYLEILENNLSLLIHSKPKLRKSSQQIIYSILSISKNSLKDNFHHSNITMVMKHFKHSIDMYGIQSTQVIHYINFLKAVVPFLEEDIAIEIIEILIKIIQLQGNSIQNLTCFDILQQMFNNYNLKKILIKTICSLNDIIALFENEVLLKQFFDTQTLLLQKLCLHDFKEGLSQISNYIALSIKSWDSKSKELVSFASSSFCKLLQTCHTDSSFEWQSEFVPKLYLIFEKYLSPNSVKTHKEAIQVFTSIFKISQKKNIKNAKKSLQLLAGFYYHKQFEHFSDIEISFKVAIQTFGIYNFLNAAINLSESNLDCILSKKWVLPLLKTTKKMQLSFFTKFILPLISKLQQNISKEMGDKKKLLEGYFSLWSLLPSFCTSPTDFSSSFKKIAPLIGEGLISSPNLQEIMILALKQILLTVSDEESRETLQSYAKNFLPILFNLYIAQKDEDKRTILYGVINSYIELAQRDLCTSYLNDLLEAFKTNLSNLDLCLHLDLCKSLVRHAHFDDLTSFNKFIQPLFEATDKRVLSKAYNILHQLCQTSPKSCPQFFKSTSFKIENLLVDSLSLTPSFVKELKLQCLSAFLHNMVTYESSFIESSVSELILCLKDHSHRTREAAYSCLIDVGHSILRLKVKEDDFDNFNEYASLIMRGLEGNPHQISCTLLGMTKVIYEFKNYVSDDLLGLLVFNLNVLMSSPSEEIILSTLSFVKLLCSAAFRNKIDPHLSTIVNSLCDIFKESKRQLKSAAKLILRRLAKRYGHDKLNSMVSKRNRALMEKFLSAKGLNNSLPMNEKGKNAKKVNNIHKKKKKGIKK